MTPVTFFYLDNVLHGTTTGTGLRGLSLKAQTLFAEHLNLLMTKVTLS